MIAKEIDGKWFEFGAEMMKAYCELQWIKAPRLYNGDFAISACERCRYTNFCQKMNSGMIAGPCDWDLESVNK